MIYQDNYSEYLESVPNIIKKCCESGKRPVLGYTSDLDMIADWDVDSFNRLLKRYLKEEPSHNNETVDSMEDFARIVSHYAICGLGGEVEITSGAVIEGVKEYFKTQSGLGGTCAQGAAALGAMGMPVVIHITDRAEEVIDWMDYEGVESVKEGKTVPLRECASKEEPLIHLIMQYTKGDIIRIHGQEYPVPVSNRLIMTYDQVHKVLPIHD